MHGQITLSSLVGVVWRHRRASLAGFLAILLLAWAVLVAFPRSYESEAKLFVRVGRESVGLDPTATTGQTLMLQKTQEDEINSSLDILKSRRLLETVVDLVGVESVLHGLPPEAQSEGGARPDAGKWLEPLKTVISAAVDLSQIRDPISQRERAIHELDGWITVGSPRRSTVISIRSETKDPRLAQKITEALTKAYLQEHVRMREADGSCEFFSDKAAELEELLEHRTAQIRDYKRAHGILSVSANLDLLKEQMSTTETSLQVAARETEFKKARIDAIEEQLEDVKPEIVNSQSNATWAGMRQRLFDLQVDEKRILATVKHDHPEAARARNQRRELERVLADFEKENNDQTLTSNPVRQQIERELINDRADLLGLEAQITGLECQKEVVHTQLVALADHERNIDRMERELSILDVHYRDNQIKLEEALIGERLNARKISNVSVVQPASFVEKPVKPNKVAILAAALFVAFTTAMAVAFIREASDQTIRSVDQIERQFGLPVAACVPRLRRGALRRGIRRNTLSAAATARCRALIQQALVTSDSEAPLSIGVLGCETGVGGSSLACQLALVAGSQFGLSTLLVDADCKRCTVSRSFRLNGAPGFNELVSAKAEVADCLQTSNARNLDLMSATSNKTEAAVSGLNPKSVSAWITRLKHSYDLVIVDLPSATSPENGLPTAAVLDRVLLVVESERTSSSQVERVTRQLKQIGVNLLGVVLNKSRSGHG